MYLAEMTLSPADGRTTMCTYDVRIIRRLNMKRSASGVACAVLAVAFALVLAACGAQGAQPAAPADSSGTAGQESAKQTAAVVYLPVKRVVNGNDGWTRTENRIYDDRGRQLTADFEVTGDHDVPWNKCAFQEWDERGYPLKMEYDAKDTEGNAYKITETASYKLNGNGALSSEETTSTIGKDSFQECEPASAKSIGTFELSSDAQVLRKQVVQYDYFDKAGNLIQSQSATSEFDDNGYETRYSRKIKSTHGDGDGHEHEHEYEQTVTFEWTKDGSGKVTALKAVANSSGATSTLTADVEVNESGMITKIHNCAVDGVARKTNCAIEYTKIDNPLPVASEGWKTVAVDELLFT